MDYRLVYITTNNLEQARMIGRALVEERLAACANILPSMRAVYSWEGEIQEAEESVLLLKTIGDEIPQITARVKELHTYSCPCIFSISMQDGNPDYFRWLSDQVR